MHAPTRPRSRFVVIVCAAAAMSWLSVATGRALADPTYWQDIRPILRKNCTVCHSTKNLKDVDVSGGLALDSYAAIRKGTKHAVIEPGKSEASILVQRVTTEDGDQRMPLGANPLNPAAIALLRQWINTGAKEGQNPEDRPAVVAAATSKRTRKLDVTLPTTAVPPKGLVASSNSAKLELALKVGPLAPVTAVAFSPDGKLLATGSYRQVTIWDLATVQPVHTLTHVLGAVNDVRFSPDGQMLAVAGGQPSAKGDLRLYSLADGKLRATLSGHDDVIFSVAFHPDGKRLASASFDKTVRIWNLTSHKAERILTGHSDFVYAVAFSPDGKWLVSASKDRSVKLVETDTGTSRLTFSGMDQDVLAVAVSPDGKNVVSSGFDTGIYWWNAQTGQRIRLQNGHAIAVHELCFSKDGKRLVSAGADKTIRVWDGATGASVRTIAAGSIAYATAIRPDGKLIASGTFDGLVRLWDAATGRQLLTLLSIPAEDDRSEWLALTPEGYMASSAGLASSVQWRVAGKGIRAEPVSKTLDQPESVVKAARGEALPAPSFGN
ncbi:MAG TPA: c-type cytochrome domain-containing protein [Gemmataceae bacterium]|nr:c-type cytochrome domain-containing protein [Gemmataceae bacterium]